jgi:hypothetical protein
MVLTISAIRKKKTLVKFNIPEAMGPNQAFKMTEQGAFKSRKRCSGRPERQTCGSLTRLGAK